MIFNRSPAEKYVHWIARPQPDTHPPAHPVYSTLTGELIEQKPHAGRLVVEWLVCSAHLLLFLPTLGTLPKAITPEWEGKKRTVARPLTGLFLLKLSHLGLNAPRPSINDETAQTRGFGYEDGPMVFIPIGSSTISQMRFHLWLESGKDIRQSWTVPPDYYYLSGSGRGYKDGGCFRLWQFP